MYRQPERAIGRSFAQNDRMHFFSLDARVPHPAGRPPEREWELGNFMPVMKTREEMKIKRS
jgi:hypothetical protein